MTVDTLTVALALYEAGRNAVAIAPLTEGHPSLTLADAYAIQTEGRNLRLADGGTLVGRKIGLTSDAMQEMLGVDQPDFGYLLDGMVHGTGAVIDGRRLIAPRAEAEIAFRLSAPVAGAEVSGTDVLAATGAVAPALEIIDSRIAGWRIAIADTVADNASCGCAVIGAWQELGQVDLAAIEATMTVTAGDGGSETSTGLGSAVLGHPAEAVAWLARALDEYGDEGLEAGQIVLPGAVSRALQFGAGSRVHATFGALGAVEATIEGALT